ncbi:MAG: Maf family nucleotide pyrophosphatase [Gammaproteobacteria bacterium]|nr:Maf family nucleotide pyrophosphatase [Gammaproteobacteria bacterium]
MRQLILGSTSPYRRELLERLHLPFTTAAPDIDETPLPGEKPEQMVLRLAEAKARKVAETHPDSIIIGGDQCSVCEGEILGKPGTMERAVEQLKKLSGKTIVFQTALCLYQADKDILDIDLIPFTVHFRSMDEAMIRRYLQKEPALNCAGSFKSEGYGIALTERLEGNDPTALIGLPLIRLRKMLEAAGIVVV